MTLSRFFVTVFVLTFMITVLTVPANASLNDNGDGTVSQVRNDGSKLMWLKDTNYAKTSGFDTDGKMTWDNAKIWIGTLNSSNYLGYNNWQLPDTLPVNGINYNISPHTFNGSTDSAYNISAPGSAYPGTTSSDMAYMYYTELGNLGYCAPTATSFGDCPQPGGGLLNTGPFSNIQGYYYWSDSVYPGNTNYAWYFLASGGDQLLGMKSYDGYHAWAMRVVPEPISSTLFIVGGVALGFRRLRKRG